MFGLYRYDVTKDGSCLFKNCSEQMEDVPLVKCCFLVLLLMWVTNLQSEAGVIQTPSGPILGSLLNVNGHKVNQYLGIPYAQPPLGDLRFRKPQPIQPWSETLNANKMPPACIQYAEYPFPWFDFQHGKSEDCLYLNIWVPENCNTQKIPVMFWIHGGGFFYGSIRKPVYNGRALAALGCVIVVTANYRLGAFGFFTTNTDDAPVNNVMFDMLKALEWVNENIGAFQGDPNQVTVFGESAGSIATGLFCISPLTKGLFNRVIMESGSHATIQYDVNATSVTISQKLAEDLGCADPLTNILTSPDKVAECMRTKDALEIAKTLNSYNPKIGVTYNPVYGNEFLPDNAREALKLGKFHNVSVLIGNNRDEGSVFLPIIAPEIFGFFGRQLPELNTSMTENIFKGIFKDTLKDIPGTELVTKAILESLSTDDYRKNLKIIYDVLGDLVLLCPTVYFAESYSRFGKNVYFYFFKHRPSTIPWAKWTGVAHYEEIQFVFGSPVKENKYTDDEIELSKTMMKIWSNFAKHGDPLYNESEEHKQSSGGLVQSNLKSSKWPLYSQATPLYLILDATTTKDKRYSLGPHKVKCDLFRAIHGFL